MLVFLFVTSSFYSGRWLKYLLPILVTSYTIRRPEISVLIYFRSLLPPDGRAHVEANNP